MRLPSDFLLKYKILLFISFFLSSCANIIRPSGGDRDIEPPKMISSSPENRSTHFDSRKITLEFDEYIQLKDVFNQVIISPPLDNKPDIKLKGKSVQVFLNEDSLKHNTTYTINFGEAIRDITEGNIIHDFQYVASTGSYVDSLQISGQVRNAFLDQIEEGVTVMLYPETSDSIVYKEKPYYFGRTNKDGEFIIQNIRPGNYKLFAIKDQNFNYLYDLPNEQISFLDSAINIAGIIPPFDLRLFQEDKVEQKLLDAYSNRYGQIFFTFARNSQGIDIRSTDLQDSLLSPILETLPGDTLRYWIRNIHIDTLNFIVFDHDKPIDTVGVRIPALPKDSLLHGMVKLKTELSSKKMNILNLKSTIQLISRHPLDTFFSENIILYEDSTLNSVTPEIELGGPANRTLYISYRWKSATFYKLVLKKGASSDIYGLHNDSLSFEFTTRKTEDYGTIICEVLLPTEDTSNYFIQLLNNSNKVIVQDSLANRSRQNYTFPYLLPGNYSIRIIKDTKPNLQWDTGNYLLKKQPEEIFYYPEKINLRSNWEMEIEIRID